MIFLNQTEPSVITIDPDLVVNYKRESDLYLINIRRTLTRQLVYYKIYYYLQKVNNSFFKIISSLLEEKYTDRGMFLKDKTTFYNDLTVFLKSCDNLVRDSVYESIEYDVNALKLIIEKLTKIIEDFCMEDKA